ncbi:MAG: hypothetical protein AB7N71_12310, partial [Phycisphaerae bacterium]
MIFRNAPIAPRGVIVGERKMMMNSLRSFCFRNTAGILVALLATLPASSAVIYVKANATGNNSGTSWANAHTDLESAFNRSQLADEIWVAAGTYKPGGATPTRSSSFRIGFAGVPIYGGFAGTETAVSQRNPVTNITILSGEIGDPNTVADNTYHVVTFLTPFGPPILDGFTITGGNANGTGNNAFGGGLLVDLAGGTYRNLV